jgi:hypothetical protein
MSAENTNEQPKAEPLKPEPSKRSASYPALTVLEAYGFALKVYNKFSTAEVTRKEVGSALGVNDVSISRDIAAVASYGFFEKKLIKGERDFKYKVTDLFNDVFRHENERQKKVSLITAFGKPKLYQDLINKFDGSVIPEELTNTLIKHHSITEAASKEVADIFISAGKEVGVINESRVLNYKVTLGATSKTQYAEIIEETPNVEPNGAAKQNNFPVKVEPVTFQNEADIRVPIHLTKNKMAYMVYPTDINNKDIKLLDHAIKGILLRLELEKEEEDNSKKEEE